MQSKNEHLQLFTLRPKKCRWDCFFISFRTDLEKLSPKKCDILAIKSVCEIYNIFMGWENQCSFPKSQVQSVQKHLCCFCCLETYLYELSKKETSPHIQLLLFPANFWTCVNICITLRHKLNMFHRHLTNTNGIKCPETKEGSISKISCVHQLLWALQFLALSLTAHD